jgi:predicted MFS family arabinose efflux permease
MSDAALAAPTTKASLPVKAGRLFVIFMGPSLGGLAPLGLAVDQPALAAHFGGGSEGMLRAGTVFSAPSLAIIVGAPLGGWLAERFGYRLTLLLALLVYALMGPAGLVIDGYLPLLATRLALGLAAGAVMAVYLALAAAYYDGDARAKVIGFAVAASTVVGMLALALGGELVELGGWRAPFALYLIGAVTLAVAWATVHGPFHERARSAKTTGNRAAVLAVARLWPVYLALILISIGTFMPSAGGPFLLKANGIERPGLQGLMLSVGSASAFFTAAGYGFLRTWFSDWALFILIATFMGAGLAAAAPLHDWLALLAAFFVVGIGTGFKAPVAASILMAQAPPHVRAAAAGLNFSCIFLGQFLGPFVLRALVAPFAIQGTFLAVGGTLLATAAAIALAGVGKDKPVPAEAS